MFLGVVQLVLLTVALRPGLAVSCGHSKHHDDESVADQGDGFQAHVVGTLGGPVVGLFEQDRADGPDGRGFVREDADYVGLRLISPVSRSVGFVECRSTC